MTMIEPSQLRGRELIDVDGAAIGRIHQVWADADTGQPEWATVSTGWFGSHVSFVPLATMVADGDVLRTRVTKDHVKMAPHVEAAGGELTRTEEQLLCQHYGFIDPSVTTVAGSEGDETGIEHSTAMTVEERERVAAAEPPASDRRVASDRSSTEPSASETVVGDGRRSGPSHLRVWGS
jgi:hypothetical protein